jgi:hypothetical protein
MPAVVPFHSIDEYTKPVFERIYHNNTECPIALDIPNTQRHTGTNGYDLCPVCRELIERKSVV